MLKNSLSDVVSPNEDATTSEEYSELEHEQFQQLFGVFACYDLVEEVLNRAPKPT